MSSHEESGVWLVDDAPEQVTREGRLPGVAWSTSVSVSSWVAGPREHSRKARACSGLLPSPCPPCRLVRMTPKGSSARVSSCERTRGRTRTRWVKGATKQAPIIKNAPFSPVLKVLLPCLLFPKLESWSSKHTMDVENDLSHTSTSADGCPFLRPFRC